MDTVRLHFPTIDSTNDYAKQHADEFDRSCLTVISSDEQTRGRGRECRTWESPRGLNVYVTFCCFVSQNFSKVHNFAQFLSFICCEALSQLQIESQLKWPNDVLIDEKKVAGVLCELSSELVINGIGLNVNMDEEELKKIPGNPTSLFCETNRKFEISELTKLLIQTYRIHLDEFLRCGFAPFLDRYRSALSHKAQDLIYFHVDGELEQGQFHSISDNGSLNLVLESGEVKNFLS
ncbi:MAG: Bifunctional ligase/repressor BirA [Chlamydiae bacterium]|nr:Bifunctional ligase/repressor BirA [Chlamydiota bacterium]